MISLGNGRQLFLLRQQARQILADREFIIGGRLSEDVWRLQGDLWWVELREKKLDDRKLRRQAFQLRQ